MDFRETKSRRALIWNEFFDMAGKWVNFEQIFWGKKMSTSLISTWKRCWTWVTREIFETTMRYHHMRRKAKLWKRIWGATGLFTCGWKRNTAQWRWNTIHPLLNCSTHLPEEKWEAGRRVRRDGSTFYSTYKDTQRHMQDIQTYFLHSDLHRG